MLFFDQKEEVIDIQLTQFGKHLLAVGAFKPVYYCFYDDDILYNTEKAGFSEHQNDTERRILEETPRLKTQYLTYSIEESYMIEDELIKDKATSKFKKIDRNMDPSVQERILLYPLREQEVAKQKVPKFEIKMLKEPFSSEATLYHLTASGIVKKIPQLHVSPKGTVKRIEAPLGYKKRQFNEEVYIDLMNPEIEFLDGSKITIEQKEIVLDVQELNTHYGLDNFNIEIYEVKTNASGDDVLIRIGDIEEINKLFHITTDEDIKSTKVDSMKQRNYNRRNE